MAGYAYQQDDELDRKRDDHGHQAGGEQGGQSTSGDAAQQSMAEIGQLYPDGAGGMLDAKNLVCVAPDVDQLALHGAATETSHVDPAAAAVAQAEIETKPTAPAAHAEAEESNEAEGPETGKVQQAKSEAPAAGEALPHAPADVLTGAATGLTAAVAEAPATAGPQTSAPTAATTPPTVASAAATVAPAGAGAPAAPGAGEGHKHASSWVEKARAYNERHGLSAQFNAATHDACGTGHDADPGAVAAWQAAHGLHPDGRIGHLTLGAANQQHAVAHEGHEGHEAHDVAKPSPHAEAHAEPHAEAHAQAHTEPHTEAKPEAKPAHAEVAPHGEVAAHTEAKPATPTVAKPVAPTPTTPTVAVAKPADVKPVAQTPAVVKPATPTPTVAVAKPVTPTPTAAKPVAPVVAKPIAPITVAPPAGTEDSFVGTEDIRGKEKDRWAAYGKGDAQTHGWDLGGAHGAKHSGGDVSAAIYAVANVEGRYDSVQTYDAGILSFGIMQWTLHAGSLQKFLGFLKDKSGPEGKAAFQDDFVAQGIDVALAGGQYQLVYNGKQYALGDNGAGKAEIDQLVRSDPKVARKWSEIFHTAGADPRVQKAQFERAKEMFHEAEGVRFGDKIVDQSLKACKNTFHAKYRSQYGKAQSWMSASPKAAALFFSMRINNPKYANAAFLKAIDAFYDAQGTDSTKWPATWGATFGDLVASKSAETLSNWGKEGGGEGRVDKTLRFWDKVHGQAGSAPTTDAKPAAPQVAKPPPAAAVASKDATKDASTTDPALDQKLHVHYAAALHRFVIGEIDQAAAVKDLIAYDQKLNGGHSSMTCLVILPAFLADLFKATMARTKPAAPVTKPAPTAPVADAKPAQVAKVAPPTVTPPTAGKAPVAPIGTPIVAPPQQQVTQPPSSPDEVFQKVYQVGGAGHLQYAQVFVSPGGLTSNKPDIFLMFHGHDTQYHIDPNQKKNGDISGLDVAAQAMTQARGKNTVAIFPQGVLGGGHRDGSKDRSDEGGFMTALKSGLPAFLESVLGALGPDLHGKVPLKLPLSPGHISLGGHSAGGYMGVNQALTGAGDLADAITDITLMDTGYAESHFVATQKWMVAGSPNKTVRIIGSAKQMQDAMHAGTFGVAALDKLAHDKHMTVEHENIKGQKRDEYLTGVQHSKLKKDGAVQADILILQYDKTHNAVKDHQPLRDAVIDDAMLSIGQGEQGSDAFGTHHQDKPGAVSAAHADAQQAKKAKVEAQAKQPTPVDAHAHQDKPHDDASKSHVDKPKKAAHHEQGKIDEFGNLALRPDNIDRTKSTGTTFSNSFTVVHATDVTDHKGKVKYKLPTGVVVHIADMKDQMVRITSADKDHPLTDGDDAWVKFTVLGGHGAAVGFGNEKTDAVDKDRADKISAGLPANRKVGESKHKWGFGPGFLPSMDGVSLSGTLMSKVHALMEWAVHNDMVTGDITISSGMRPLKTAHYMAVRFELATGDSITLDALKALPGGRDHDGNLWYKEGWTLADAKQAAVDRMKKEHASGKVAVAGYNPGDPRRAPLNATRPGVSRHCSGHAVDVVIPWRTADGKGTDEWAWEQIYHQFGLTRPMHRDLQSNPKFQESWHIEETGKALSPEGELSEDA